MKSLAEELIKQINPSAKIIADNKRLRPTKSEVFRLYGSNKKIKENTNWALQYSLSEGLKETIEWFKNRKNLKNYKANIYNI